MIVGIVTRSVRILFSHSTESRPAEGASNDDRSSVRAGLPRAIASATSRLRPPTCRTRAVPRFPPPSDALLSPVGIPRVTEGGRDRVEVPALRFAKLAFNADARRDARAGRPPIRAFQGAAVRRRSAPCHSEAWLPQLAQYRRCGGDDRRRPRSYRLVPRTPASLDQGLRASAQAARGKVDRRTRLLAGSRCKFGD